MLVSEIAKRIDPRTEIKITKDWFPDFKLNFSPSKFGLKAFIFKDEEMIITRHGKPVAYAKENNVFWFDSKEHDNLWNDVFKKPIPNILVDFDIPIEYQTSLTPFEFTEVLEVDGIPVTPGLDLSLSSYKTLKVKIDVI